MIVIAKFINEYNYPLNENIANTKRLNDWCLSAINEISINTVLNFKRSNLEDTKLSDLRKMRKIKNRLSIVGGLKEKHKNDFDPVILKLLENSGDLP